MKNNTDFKHFLNDVEIKKRKDIYDLLIDNPIPSDQLLDNIGLFIDSKRLSRLLFLNHIYKKIIDLQGVIFDFGTRWGQNAAFFSSLRGIYEPYNRHRKIIAFDTFSGFPKINKKDGSSNLMKKGNVATTQDYEKYLEKILNIHEDLNPLSHIRKFEIIKGDATKTLEKYLKNNPQTIVSLAYFDFDIYEPTKRCLDILLPRLTKGSVIGFDELNDADSPGETIALMESMGLTTYSIKRYRYSTRVSYIVIE